MTEKIVVFDKRLRLFHVVMSCDELRMTFHGQANVISIVECFEMKTKIVLAPS